MTIFHLIFTVLVASGVLAYFRQSLMMWATVIAGCLVVYSLLTPSFAGPIFSWLVYLGLIIPLSVPSIRRNVISDRIYPILKHAIPTMSNTEKEALEAGTVWWDGELFSGMPSWKKMLAFPSPRLSSEEQAFLDGPVEALCALIDDWKITHEDADLSPQVWQFIKDNGFFGMIIPKKYGGKEFSALAHSTVVMKIAGRSISAAVTIMVPNSLGPAELLLHYGTDEQKSFYLPRLASGKEVPCFALTGPEAGSDAGSIPDKGIVCKSEFQGQQDVLGIRLNWEKRYITLGPVATVLGLAFKLYDPDHLLGDETEIGITLALIPTATPGIDIGRRHAPLNMAFQNGPNSGKDVFIPMDWIIGGAKRVGEGWRMLMESLAAGRSISLPALSTGGGKLVCRATGAYARVRKQFKMPIGRFEGVEEVLARIAGYTYLMEAARVMTAGAVDLGEKPSVVSAIVKYHLTERMRQVVNDAMDVQGGSGICMGPRNLLARIYQAIPVSITVEGANILTRTLIIFGQGAVRCHPYVLDEIQALSSDTPENHKKFDKALFGHIGFITSNWVRALFLGVTGAKLVQINSHPEVKRYYQRATRLSSAFALASDVAMFTLGAALKRKEKLSGRLADVFSQLYLVTTVLKHFEDQGRQEDDLPLLQWACEDAFYKAQTSMVGLIRNLPNRVAAVFLRIFIFPLGYTYKPPSDKLGHKVATILLTPSKARDRLTADVFIPENVTDSLGRIEDAFQKICQAEPIEKKLQYAFKAGRVESTDFEQQLSEALSKKILDDDEVKILKAAKIACRDAIDVDDFSPEYFKRRVLKEAESHGATDNITV